MGKIIDIVREELLRQEWKFQEAEEDQIQAGAKGKNGSYRVLFRADETKERLNIHILSAVYIPQESRPQVAEYLTRCNYGLILGNFEMDFSDGEMRYKVSVDVEAGELSKKMVENMIDAGCVTMDRFFGGFLSVCYGGKDAETAYNDARGIAPGGPGEEGSASAAHALLAALVGSRTDNPADETSSSAPVADETPGSAPVADETPSSAPVADATPVIEELDAEGNPTSS